MQSWIDTIAGIAIVCTFVVYALQLRAMNRALTASFEQISVIHKQIGQGRRGAELESLLAMIQFLQDTRAREDRRVLINLKSEPFENWSPSEIDSAERVCQAYDITAILIREGLLPEEPIILNWGHSIRLCLNAALPMLLKYRTERGETFWDDFSWLAAKVPAHPNFGVR